MARNFFIPAIWGNANPGDITEPTSTKQDNGWAAEKPPFQNFNWFWNLSTGLLQHIEQYGIAEWNTNTIYPNNGFALGSDGRIYQSIVVSNQGNDPVSSPSQWEDYLIANTSDVSAVWDSEVAKTTDYTILDTDKGDLIYLSSAATAERTFTFDNGFSDKGTVFVYNQNTTYRLIINDGTDDILFLFNADKIYKLTKSTLTGEINIAEA